VALLDDEPRSVAVVRLRTGLGDLLCGVPGLRALRARLPRARIALLTYAEMAPVVERQRAYVDELIAFPGDPGIPERPPRDAETEPFYAAMRARRFDLAIQAYGARPAANAVTARLGAGGTAGFFTPGAWDADLATHIPYPIAEHEVRRHLRLMAHLGAPPCGEHLEFPLSAADEAAAEAVRRAHGLVEGPYALVHPGATSPSRRWPAERFAAVADALATAGLRVAVTGVAGEEAIAAGVVTAARSDVVDLTGRTGLGGFAALLRDATVLVANDTGSAHLAAAVGTPSVVVFLAGDPVRWAAPDRRRHRVARVAVECNPCSHLVCPIDHRCATRLPADAVAAQALDLIAGRVAAPA
jgi:ADP-heptose:LPS heptosyltransferase